MRVKKCLSMLLAVIMIGTMITSLPITASAVDVDAAATADNTVKTAGTVDELNAVCSEINNNGGTYTIDLTESFEGQVKITNEAAVVTVISSKGKTLTNPTTAVYVENGATVKLGGNGNTKLTLQGNDQPHNTGEGNDDPGLIYILPGSTCEMNENVTLKDRKGNNYLGGGVTVQGGSFIMNGGTIENCGIDGGSVCYGGGVAVYAGGTFIMNGGMIDRCYVLSDYIDDYDPEHCFTALGGGVFVTGGSSFTMNGGTISNCDATNFGGGIAMVIAESPSNNSEWKTYKMGNPKSNVTINGGTITGNTADRGAGVFASGYHYAYAGPIGYIPSDATFNPGLFINGGKISSNEADGAGGGVLVEMVRPAATVQIHNAEITDNTADNGAGIENFGYWTQLDIDGCTITGNKAVTKGGGIMLSTNSSGGYTNLKNTTVTGNTSGDRGAGVYYDADSEIRISGADIIQDNKFNGKLNNLNIYSLDKPVKVIGDLTGSQIGLSDPELWDDGLDDYDADAVSTLRLTDGYKDNNASLSPADAFTSDHESWIVDFGEIKTKTVTSDDDFYTYSAQKYNVKTRTDSGESCRGEIYSVKANTFTSGVAENPDVFKQEVLSRFSDTSKYQLEYSDSNWNDYTKLDTGEPVSVYFPNIYNAYIYINPNNNYSNPRLITSTGHQTQYAESGTFVYQYYIANSETIEYSDEYDTVEFYYNELLDSDMTVYDYDEFGHIISQTVVNKTPVKTPHQETIIELRYDKEVRLVRRKPEYHINNDDIDNNYDNNDIFTSYIEEKTGEVKVGDTIRECYTIPEVKADKNNSCPYIFKGWYYDQENDNDTHPVMFGTDKYAKDIYAHWIKVDDVDKDAEDTNKLPAGYTKYGGFDLCGVQVRKERTIDSNFGGESMPGGLRFVTSLSKDVVDKINAIKPNNIEYGYVATNQDKEGWINYHKHFGRKLQYVSDGANGINTSESATDDKNYFGFATNVVCTSKQSNGTGGVVREDHRSYGDYLLYTLVVTYEGDDGTGYEKNVLARPYIRYKDANGLDRVAYSEYRGNSNTLGGCYTSYNTNNPDA